jgi:catechol 2,3-dioxygenase-like lactoylglutathione lyase family enzyme
MQLAKNVIDVGLSTNHLEPMLRFWQQDAAVRFDHVQPVRRGQKQYRHDEQGSVIKLNHHAEPLPEAAPSGYRELMIAREGLQKPQRMADPDGNHVQLVPPGQDGVSQIAVVMAVRDLSEHRRFYGDILGFAEQSWSGGPAFSPRRQPRSPQGRRSGDHRSGPSSGRLALHHLPSCRYRRRARRATTQGRARRPCPITLGDVARISMILDPDGNWIELSRRASVVGSLS